MLIAVTFIGSAQSMQVATLSHDGTVTSYTSATALRDAYAAAVDGDVISLSSGTFTAVNFEKRITVRGAGMGVKVNDTDPYVEPTLLVGDFSIKAGGNDENAFKLEGILSESRVSLIDFTKSQFAKCKFREIYCIISGTFEQITFTNCIVYERISFTDNTSTNFYGCYLANVNFTGNGSHHDLTNCIIAINKDSKFYDQQSIIKNSIYLNNSGYGTCVNYGNVFNSIWVGIHYNNVNTATKFPFNDAREAHNNTFVPEGVNIFKEGTFYQLTDAAKKYLGDDGTEVGLYGGSLPFDPTPTNPQITKFNVAPKTTADGKLSVDIEVNAK